MPIPVASILQKNLRLRRAFWRRAVRRSRPSPGLRRSSEPALRASAPAVGGGRCEEGWRALRHNKKLKKCGFENRMRFLLQNSLFSKSYCVLQKSQNYTRPNREIGLPAYCFYSFPKLKKWVSRIHAKNINFILRPICTGTIAINKKHAVHVINHCFLLLLFASV